jgi:hypothetical protein
MRLSVFLITRNEALRDYFALKKNAIVPGDALKRGYYKDFRPVVSLFNLLVNSQTSAADVEEYLVSRTVDDAASIVLVDAASVHLLTNVRNAFLVAVLRDPGHNPNYQNYFHPQIAQALRGLSQVLSRFSSFDNFKLMALPLRNFRADDLDELARLHREEWSNSTFGELIDAQLANLRRRVRPRRRSEFKNVYAVDNNGRFFNYGFEKHARQATGGNHRHSCELSAKFRFGVKIESEKHYNVSETEGDDTTIEGSFHDCHGELHIEKRKSHLNMFASDFF